MNIAFIHSCFIQGGVERVTIDIIRFLSHANGKYRCFVYAGRFDDEKRKELEAAGALTRTLRSGSNEQAEDVQQFIQEDRIDLLVQSSYRLKKISRVRKNTGVKIIYANHGEPFWQRYSIIYRRTKTPFKRLTWRLYKKYFYKMFDLARRKAVARSRKAYKECDAYTVLCEAYRSQTCKAFNLPPDRSHIYAIENPETAVMNPSLQKEKIILFCGRMENTSKRIDRILRIWSRIQDQLQDWKLVLLGDGPHELMIRKIAEDLHLKRTEFIGKVADPSVWYRKASVVCLTSQTEGWPLCLTEAQAHGCLPVAFRCSAGIDAICCPDEGCGFTVTPFNEEEYAQVLLKISRMPEESLLKMRRAAVRKRLEYTPEKTAAKWKNLFDSLSDKKNC